MNNILDKLDAFFANKRTNDKRIILATPALIVLFLMYQFEVPYIQNASIAKKQEAAELKESLKDVNEYLTNAPDLISTLSAKDIQIKQDIETKKLLIDELNNKISISEVTKYAKERSMIVFENIYNIASSNKIRIIDANSSIGESNKSGFAPNAIINLKIAAPSYPALLSFVDKIEKINEPITIKKLSIDSDLNASMRIDIWGHLVK
jgi:hypothetical protein